MPPEIIVKPNSIAVLGYHSGSAGQTETWLEKVTGYHIACFVHETDEHQWTGVDPQKANEGRVSKRMDFPTKDSFKGRPLIASINWIDHLKRLGINKVLPLTQGNRLRLRQIKDCLQNGIELITAIHPTVIVMPEVMIEPGVWISAGSIIGYKSEIQAGTMIGPSRVIIGQHNVIERCTEIQPGTTLTGNVTVRECATIHAGVTVIPRVEIGHDAIVGAGAVGIENVPINRTVVGVPARIVK